MRLVCTSGTAVTSCGLLLVMLSILSVVRFRGVDAFKWE